MTPGSPARGSAITLGSARARRPLTTWQRRATDLHRADAHHRRGAADGLDQRGTEVRLRLVLDPADGGAGPGAGTEPRVGDTGEIGGHEEHLGGSRGERRCDLAQTFAGSSDDGDRSLRRVQQRRSGIAEIVQEPGLSGVWHPHVAILRAIPRKTSHGADGLARDQAQGNLVEIGASTQRLVTAETNECIHDPPVGLRGRDSGAASLLRILIALVWVRKLIERWTPSSRP